MLVEVKQEEIEEEEKLITMERTKHNKPAEFNGIIGYQFTYIFY